ncbi:MAG: hypothetical protein J6S53_05700 [Lentisphaeria bacterium]|nr:hypothetical protein [Lentisphaeria bacterium]
MKSCFSSVALFAILHLFYPVLSAKQDQIEVYRTGRSFLVRSSYSEKFDLVIFITKGSNESAFLLRKNLPITSTWKDGLTLHRGGDEYPANPPLGKYGTLSGNHGSIYAAKLTIMDHGLTLKNIGDSFLSESKKEFVIMDVPEKNTVLVHNPGVKNTLSPQFARPYEKKLYLNGKVFHVRKMTVTQLYPMNRITKWDLLADGKYPIPDKIPVKCSFVDFHFVHDVLDPYEAVQSVKNNPGKVPSPRWNSKMHMIYLYTEELRKEYPVYAAIPSLATFENRYRFDPFGAAVNYRKTTFHVPLSETNGLEVMMNRGGLLGKGDINKLYIPKLKKFSVMDQKTGEVTRTYDFASGEDMRLPMTTSYRISRKDCINQNDLPDRYIRIAGTDTPEYGAVFGYSLFSGCTAKGKDQTRDVVYFIYKSKKHYPYAYKLMNIKPGTVMECIAYKQYFDPAKEKDATSFYYHFQGDSLIVYADFHKEVKNKVLTLPSCAAGRKITVLEKTPGMTLHTEETIPADASFTVSTAEGNNYIVLKLDAGNKK